LYSQEEASDESLFAGHCVKDTKSPLREGGLERAADWAKGILESKSNFVMRFLISITH